MSKQLTISASVAVVSMALFAVIASLGGNHNAAEQGRNAPLIGLTVSR